jgi:hypothetical protein
MHAAGTWDRSGIEQPAAPCSHQAHGHNAKYVVDKNNVKQITAMHHVIPGTANRTSLVSYNKPYSGQMWESKCEGGVPCTPHASLSRLSKWLPFLSGLTL